MWLIYIMNTKFFNHYPREWDTLGNEWKEIITGDVLSISQASELSGFSKRFIYAQIHSMKLLSTDKDPLSKHIDSKSLQIEWRRFLMWYSHFDILPASPFGPPSYSLKGMMKYMGRSRSWSLIFASRYNIQTFFIGSLRRFNKYDVEEGWKKESIYFKDWIDIDEIENYLHISKANLYSCVAKREVRTRFHSGIMQFLQKDVLRIIKDNQINYHNEL